MKYVQFKHPIAQTKLESSIPYNVDVSWSDEIYYIDAF